MLFYISILLFVMLFAVVENSDVKIPCSHAILFMVLWTAAGTSRGFSVDYGAYEQMYSHPDEGLTIFLEPVWVWLSETLRSLGFASRAWFMLVSLVVMAFFFHGIKKMSPNFTLSVVIFVASFFYFETLNLMRQFVAISILFAAFPFVIENKTWKYLVAVLIAAQFHMSAYIMLPLILLVKIRYRDWVLWLLLGISFLFDRQIMGSLFDASASLLGGVRYASYLDINPDLAASTHVLRFFYNIIAAAILLVANRIRELNPGYYLYVNAVVISIILYNIFYSYLPAMRVSWYLLSLLVILFPITLRAFSARSRTPIVVAIVCAFVIASLRGIYGQTDLDYGFDLLLFQ